MFLLVVACSDDSASSARAPTSPAAPSSTEPLRSLDDLLEPMRAEHDLVALAAAVVDREGVVSMGTVGRTRADADDRVAPDARWHLGSDTKAMTATLAAMLVADGSIAWETRVSTLVPGALPAFENVTLVELFAHRAGLEPDLIHRYPQVWSRLWEQRRPLSAERRWFAETMLAQPPRDPPGSTYRYANAGYIIGGSLLERATGHEWEHSITTRLFGPLQMSSCGFGAPSGDGQPWGHRDGTAVRPGPSADNPAALGPAGTVHCSLEDWAKFVALHLRGAVRDTSLLPRSAFARLHAPPANAPTAEYGYGWLIDRRNRTLHHEGSNTMWYATVHVRLNDGLAYLVATNQGEASAETNAVIRALRANPELARRAP